MPINPKINQDQRRQTIVQNDPSTFSGPKRQDGENVVKMEQDDLYPERKERLGDFLTSITSGDGDNPDVVTSHNNAYPISGPDENSVQKKYPYNLGNFI